MTILFNVIIKNKMEAEHISLSNMMVNLFLDDNHRGILVNLFSGLIGSVIGILVLHPKSIIDALSRVIVGGLISITSCNANLSMLSSYLNNSLENCILLGTIQGISGWFIVGSLIKTLTNVKENGIHTIIPDKFLPNILKNTSSNNKNDTTKPKEKQ
jgi:uncharacterized membrane protein YeaQ/YmgE (transglycosylase-associated protein family)